MKKIVIFFAVWVLQYVILAIAVALYDWQPVSVTLVKPSVLFVGFISGWVPAMWVYKKLSYNEILQVYDGRFLSLDDTELHKAVSHYKGDHDAIMKHFKQDPIRHGGPSRDNIMRAIQMYEITNGKAKKVK